MSKFLITYDLNKPGQNYAAVEKTLLAICTAVYRPQKSVWFVSAPLRAESIVDITRKHALDANDTLIVIEIPDNADWATYGIDSASNGWLKLPAKAA